VPSDSLTTGFARIYSAVILEQYAEPLFEQFLQRHHGELQRNNRRERRSDQAEQRVSCNRRDLHRLHDLETIGHIGEGLDVGAAHQRLARKCAAAQPFGIELAPVTLSERTEFAQAGPLRLGKRGRQRGVSALACKTENTHETSSSTSNHDVFIDARF